MDLFSTSFWSVLFSGVFSVAVAYLPTCTYTYEPDKSPRFPNGTQMCCGECRYMVGEKRCVQSEIIIAVALCSLWVGALIAFFFDRFFGSPLPGSMRMNCRNCCYACMPCIVGPCCPAEALLEVSSADSRFKRNGTATSDDGFAGGGTDDTEYFFEEEYDEDGGRRWRESALDADGKDGIDETCHGNVTVHSF